MDLEKSSSYLPNMILLTRVSSGVRALVLKSVQLLGHWSVPNYIIDSMSSWDQMIARGSHALNHLSYHSLNHTSPHVAKLGFDKTVCDISAILLD